MKVNAPAAQEIESTPRCCPRCFDDRSLKSVIGRYGKVGNDCDFCGATGVRTLGVRALSSRLAPLFEGYATAEAGTHFIPQIEEADGDPLDYLLDEDNPGLFAPDLGADRRQHLVQALLDAIDGYEIAEAWGPRSASDLWVRPGSEIWAGAKDDLNFLTAPERWRLFVQEVSHETRYFRLHPEVDPQTYLTPALLKSLARRLSQGTLIYRAVIGGVLKNGGLIPHPANRMAGPGRGQSKEGMRVNAAGVPVLYAAKDIPTVIAEVRPWVGAPVSVATLRLDRPVRLVDFRPRRREQAAGVAPRGGVLSKGVSKEELHDILATIGEAMARPIDPADSQVSYVPTQYVAEVVRGAGYDGVTFQSAVGPGVNVVLFDKSLARVDRVDLYEVTRVKYAAVPTPAPPEPDDTVDFF